MSERHLHGVLVTYRRPKDLERSLARLAGQDRRLDRLVVVDNDPTSENEAVVRAGAAAAGEVLYQPMSSNIGFSGGLAAGMARLLDDSEDDDWIVVLDDDDPPDDDDAFGDLLGFARETLQRDPRTAAVGLRGARFDPRRGLLQRVPTRELNDSAIPVDCIAGNALPLYRVAALRDAGTFATQLFFSHEELELGMRLRRHGYTLYGHGAAWRARREGRGRPDVIPNDQWRLLQPNWRSYYSLRNTIFILRSNGRPGVALRLSVSRGFLKPLLHVLVAPRAALKALAFNARACKDGWQGRLGRRIEPDVREPRPKRASASA